ASGVVRAAWLVPSRLPPSSARRSPKRAVWPAKSSEKRAVRSWPGACYPPMKYGMIESENMEVPLRNRCSAREEKMIQNDALSLEYKLVNGRASRDFHLADVVNDPAGLGVVWIS